MKVQFDNTSILHTLTEQCTLQALASPGTDVDLIVDDNSGFADDDFVMVGSLMSPRTEIAQINDTVVVGTGMRVATLVFPHNPTDIITKMYYNQVKLYNAETEAGTKTLVDTLTIDVEKRYTDFEVSDDTSGFLFFSLYNSSSTTESGFSAPIAVDNGSHKTLQYIRDFIDVFYKSKTIDDDKLRILVDTVIEEIYNMRKWKWREGTATFATVDGQIEYDIVDDCNITDFDQLLSARTDTEHLSIISSDKEDMLQLRPMSLTPMTITQWGDKFYIHVNGVKTITIKYYKSAEAMLTSGSETSVKLISAVGYGVLKLLYLTKDTDMSDRFEAKQDMAIKIMTRADDKNASRITSLRETNMVDVDVTPNIISD